MLFSLGLVMKCCSD